MNTWQEMKNQLTPEQIQNGHRYWKGRVDGARLAFVSVKNELGADHPMTRQLWEDYLEVDKQYNQFSILIGQRAMQQQIDNSDNLDWMQAD